MLDHCLILLKVTELTPSEIETPAGGYGKTIAHVVLGLKTVKGTKTLKLVRSLVFKAFSYSESGPEHLRKPPKRESGNW